MEDNNFKTEEHGAETTPTIHVNEYGATKDSTVVVEEADRTVLLTDDETIIIPKETMIDIPPKNRERKVYAGMWGTTELVTVGVSMLAILTTILVFVFLVMPAQRELNSNLVRRDELDKELTTAKSRYGNITSTQDQVNKILTSVTDFEAYNLAPETTGKAALAQQINGLINAYGLTNTAGPDYAALEISDGSRNNSQTDADRGRSKFISIYPGQYITMTLDGSYQNLRRFIREIETNRSQFVIISAIELEPSENKEEPNDITKPQQASVSNPVPQQNYNPGMYNQPGYPNNPNPQQVPQQQQQTATKIDRGKTRGETVTLRIELAAYYRRPNMQPQTASFER